MKSKLKTENETCIKTCPTTVRQCDTTKKKKTPTKKSQIISNIISNNIYNNLHHFELTMETPKQNRFNVHKTSVEKVKNFLLPRNYFMVCHSLIFLGPV